MGSRSFGQETLTEAVRGEVSTQRVGAEPADLFRAGRAGRGREQERMRVCGWGGSMVLEGGTGGYRYRWAEEGSGVVTRK